MSLLRDRSFRAASLAHLGVDLLNAERPLLLAVLSAPLGLTNTLIGLVSLIHTLVGSLLQPIFGLLADRVGVRWVAAGGTLWIVAMFALAVVTPGWGALVFLVLSALGSASFHPAGATQATDSGSQHPERREVTSTSIFFLFGQIGFIIGPAIGGPILDLWGPPGLLLLMALVLPLGINAARNLGPLRSDDPAQGISEAPAAASRGSWSALVTFAALAALQSWGQTNMTTFLPKYYSDLGYTATHYGLIAALFMVGTALGGVSGGWLGDRYDRDRVVGWTLMLGAVPLALFPALGGGPWASLVAVSSGALTGASYSIIIVTGQRLLPGQRGTASGLVLGFTFASGSLGTLLSGLQADRAGWEAVFLTTAAFTLAAGLLALTSSLSKARRISRRLSTD